MPLLRAKWLGFGHWKFTETPNFIRCVRFAKSQELSLSPTVVSLTVICNLELCFYNLWPIAFLFKELILKKFQTYRKVTGMVQITCLYSLPQVTFAFSFLLYIHTFFSEPFENRLPHYAFFTTWFFSIYFLRTRIFP